MSILKNAIDSIAIGLEDFESTDERRIISATRNIFAGILLLFKHKLCELSPEDSDEALIKQTVLPEIDDSGSVNWVGRGKKTVDVRSIEERFKSLNISVDWKKLGHINTYRNDIEHYYSPLTHESIQKLISDSFLIIRDFITDELGKDPRELLGEDYWRILVDTNEVYEKEKKKCNESLERLNYFIDKILHALQEYSCTECGSDLIETADSGDAINAYFKCRVCESKVPYDEIVSDVINDYYAGDAYIAATDGGDTPVISCPSCYNDTYVFHEGVCAACGYSANHECSRCGASIPSEEISDGNFCGYCSYMIAKVMDE
ncbi:hypothetical protein ACM3N8_16285 [Aeromonas sp. A04]|uniref:hypothetical protein n=1 Tax=Aeromonas sp. A04 TaxID=3398359 RepID=UPI0039F6E681